MSRAVFQAGLRWADIDRQWVMLLQAFDNFDPRKVAGFDETDIRRLMATPGILHSERKIEATIANAGVLIGLDRDHQGFRNYLRSHRSYAGVVADLKRRFSYVGDVSAYYFLFRVGEPVPPFGRWIRTVKGDHPRIRAMVAIKQRRRRSR
ncbi:MAG: DNA-3-methyladenine glycosylase I [Candidatus Eremiobacteraeota bacterium]|nr:DNA-3-methyladenine glycosylase I [Candidatus Eremiobacteraeota bacterium]MBV8281126.1 DNA-3-methyladenine glycosylase I [Candidatus Eremiobacteraeota bacterium]